MNPQVDPERIAIALLALGIAHREQIYADPRV